MAPIYTHFVCHILIYCTLFDPFSSFWPSSLGIPIGACTTHPYLLPTPKDPALTSFPFCMLLRLQRHLGSVDCTMLVLACVMSLRLTTKKHKPDHLITRDKCPEYRGSSVVHYQGSSLRASDCTIVTYTFASTEQKPPTTTDITSTPPAPIASR